MIWNLIGTPLILFLGVSLITGALFRWVDKIVNDFERITIYWRTE